MNIFYLVDDQNHTAYETDAVTVSDLASELNVGGNWNASVGRDHAQPSHILKENDAVSFVSVNKTGGDEE